MIIENYSFPKIFKNHLCKKTKTKTNHKTYKVNKNYNFTCQK